MSESEPATQASRDRPPSPARERVARAVAQAAKHFPDLGPQDLDVAQLESRDAALARSLHRTILQRWLTLEHLLAPLVRKPLAKVEAPVRASLLVGAAQILFYDRTPRRVAVDEAVRTVAAMGRPQAKGLVNAVLRKLSDRVQSEHVAESWQPLADRIPFDEGSIALTGRYLPKPDNMVAYLAAATSHPLPLIARWQKAFGNEAVLAMAQHNVVVPPTVVTVEPELLDGPSSELWQPHTVPGHVIWQGDHDELIAFLAGNSARRVQDVTSTQPVAALTQSVQSPGIILDYCAGMGTKTRQLAAAYPDSRIVATDTDTQRLYELAQSLADMPNVDVMPIAALPHHLGDGQADVLLLDVPCSNTGVLARRPEARYRFSAASLESLFELQRDIIQDALRFAQPHCALLYSTCSIEVDENAMQALWIGDALDFNLLGEHQTLPQGAGRQYQDGGYWALMTR